MKELVIKLTRDNFNFRFKQYEGMYFHANINEDSEAVSYTHLDVYKRQKQCYEAWILYKKTK